MAAPERHGRERGLVVRLFRLRRNQDAARRAEEELTMFKTGEPSQAFYPPPDNVVFLSKEARRRNRKYKGTIATKEDIENRIREQNETCVVVERLGQMTPQWWRYKFNHIEEIIELMG